MTLPHVFVLPGVQAGLPSSALPCLQGQLHRRLQVLMWFRLRLPSLLRALALCLSALLPAAVAAQVLTVSAAASLGEALREVARGFEAAHPGTNVRLNLAASGALVQQIIQGAPVDVFISADVESIARGDAAGVLAPAPRVNVASNRLVLVVPASGGLSLGQLAELQSPAVKRVAIGKPATVPAGRYAAEALRNAGLWGALQPRLVFADTVRQVLDYVARGEAEAGLVYATDAGAAPQRVRVLFFVDGHAPVRYPATVVAASRHADLAGRFVQHLAGVAAQAILARHGFGKPS